MIKEKVILEILKNVLELDTVDKTCSQSNCENWDSLRHLNLVIELESELDLSFEPEEIAEMKSYAAIERIISSKY